VLTLVRTLTNKRPDNSRAATILGHQCRVTLDQGLPWTVEWQNARYGKRGDSKK